MAAKKAKKAATKTGGAREGSGRRALYGEPLDHYVTVRVNDEQGRALGAWCIRYAISPATLIRENALERVGAAHLGIGLRKAKGTAEKAITLTGAACFAVKMTAKQHAAIVAYCEKKRIAPGTFLREAALEKIGERRLGAAGALAEAERVARAVAGR